MSETSGVIQNFINSGSDWSYLTTLNLRISEPVILEQITPFLGIIQQSKKLKTLKLEFCFFPIKEIHFNGVLEVLKSCPLTNLRLEFTFEEEGVLDSFATFLANSNGFKNLEIYIFSSIGYQTSSKCLFPALKKVIAKSFQLETFYLMTDQLKTLEEFQELLDQLAEKSSTLKELLIQSIAADPSIEQFSKILRSLNKLTQLKILNIRDIHIPDEKQLEKLIRITCKWKDLQRLELGTVLAINSIDMFVQLIENLVSKRGLEMLRCEVSRKLYIELNRHKFSNLIDKDMVRRKNPFLERCPDSLPIFAKEAQE